MRITRFLNQQRFPRLWLLFQVLMGGTIDKRKLCLAAYRGEKSLLEVGCSSGNIATTFLKIKDLNYTGLDIDPVAIRFAQKRFIHKPGYTFICEDLLHLSESTAKRYDLILFPGVFHHVSDDQCRNMLAAGRKLLSPNGRIAVIDVLAALPSDKWYVKFNTHSLEDGQFVREESSMKDLMNSVEGMRITETSVKYIGSTFLSLPKVARFGTYELTQATS